MFPRGLRKPFSLKWSFGEGSVYESLDELPAAYELKSWRVRPLCEDWLLSLPLQAAVYRPVPCGAVLCTKDFRE